MYFKGGNCCFKGGKKGILKGFWSNILEEILMKLVGFEFEIKTDIAVRSDFNLKLTSARPGFHLKFKSLFWIF